MTGRSPMMKFTLPVGATLGGMIHLGGGVFAGHAFPAATPQEHYRRRTLGVGRVTTVIEGLDLAGDDSEFTRARDENGGLPTEWHEDARFPLDGQVELRRRCALLTWPEGLTEVQLCARFGISHEELMRRLDAGL